MHIKKALGVMLVVLGLFFLLISIASSSQPPHPATLVIMTVLFFLSIAFVVVGIILFRSGNAEIRSWKAQVEKENQIEANLDKDRRIKELERRLEKIEEDKKEQEKDDNS